MVSLSGVCLADLGPRYQGQRRVVEHAVKQDGLALEHASAYLRDDRFIVLWAVEQNAMAIRYASDRLRADLHIGRAAVAKNPDAYWLLLGLLKFDAQIVFRAMNSAVNPMAVLVHAMETARRAR